jgi:hypothetical protein
MRLSATAAVATLRRLTRLGTACRWLLVVTQASRCIESAAMEALSLATRGSGRGLPPAVAAAVAAADSLRLCDSIRAAALEVPTCRRDCRCVSSALPSVLGGQ